MTKEHANGCTKPPEPTPAVELSHLIPVPESAPDAYFVPDTRRCYELWDQYKVPEHIRAHSHMVGDIAHSMAQRGEAIGALAKGTAQLARACGYLHDLAKMFAVDFGGNHAQLGGAWALAETGNPVLAQGVVHHVWWPFDIDPTKYFVSLCVLYADKRVRHDETASLGARFTDLFERYGKSEYARERIHCCLQQARAIEHTLSELLEVQLHACAFDRGRLVA